MAARVISEAHLLGPVFDALPVGVVVLDKMGLVRVFNKHEERLANRTRARVIGRPFFDEVAPCMNVRELGTEFLAKVAEGTLDNRVDFSFPFPHVDQPRDVVVRMQSIIIEGEPHALLLVEDVSMQRAVERLKESLASLLVHDFKNPVSVIHSNLEFVRALVGAAQPEMREAIDDSILATSHLHAMILNLLDIARLETGTFPVVRALTDVQGLVADSVRSNATLARDVGVELVAEVPELLDALLDASVIARALSNLIENAIRHAPRGSSVVVSAVNQSGMLVLRVSDQGPGVPRELRESIFEKFAQGSDHGRSTSNRGLGLTFVRMVARAHGGDVTVEETGPFGATFMMRLYTGAGAGIAA